MYAKRKRKNKILNGEIVMDNGLVEYQQLKNGLSRQKLHEYLIFLAEIEEIQEPAVSSLAANF
jgi:hypothetical protein